MKATSAEGSMTEPPEPAIKVMALVTKLLMIIIKVEAVSLVTN